MPLNKKTKEAEEKNKRFEEICSTISDTLKRKNNDYGDSFSSLFEEFGMDYAVGHMKEKINRIKQLSHSEAMVNESLNDSLMDLAGYAILTLATLQEKDSKKIDYSAYDCTNENWEYEPTLDIGNVEEKYKKIVSGRMEFNKKIISLLDRMYNLFPDVRFGQALYCLDTSQTLDLFSEEPEDTYNRMKYRLERLENNKEKQQQ